MKVLLIPLAVSVACVSTDSHAADYHFDANLLGENSSNIDMTIFNEGGQQPGAYTVDIILNGDVIESREIIFSLENSPDGKSRLFPCLSLDDLARYGVMTEMYPELTRLGDKCARITAIPYANFEFVFNNQQLLINIPQVSMRPESSGLAPQELWDEGIPALLLNYRANTNRVVKSESETHNNREIYAQLNPGLNIGAWRIRNQTNLQRSQKSNHWETVYTYAERGLKSIKSRVTLGQQNTLGDIFDSVPFMGAMLGTDDNMIPDNQHSFSPVVRGIARTQSRIEVVQNGYVIYNATVAPGPFELNDLSGISSSNGELQVTVHEADGRNEFFTIPWQTPVISVRKGYAGYNIVAARYRPADPTITMSRFAQGSFIYGLPWDLSIYSGLQVAEHYHATSFGLGRSFGNLGAVSFDTQSSVGSLQNKDYERGKAWRIRYSKSILSTNTSLSLTTTRYASGRYYSLSEVLDTWKNIDTPESIFQGSGADFRKSATSLQLTQQLGSSGFLNLNASRTDFHNRPGHDNNVGISYGFSLFGMTFTLGLSKVKQIDKDGNTSTERQGSLSVSLPLNNVAGQNTNLSYQLTSASPGGESHDVGINGYAYDNRLFWDVRQRYEKKEGNNAVRLSWSGKYGQVGGMYNRSPSMTQMGADISGGMLLHSHGLTVSQTLGDTIALVEAPGASDIPVNGSSGVKTDSRGYTTVSSITPYQENIISLAPTSMSAEVEIPQTDRTVVPTEGAVVSAKFMPRIGRKALITLIQLSGEPVPFGSVVMVEGVGGGVVGEEGQVYLTGLPKEGNIFAKWKNGKCAANYALPNKTSDSGMDMINAKCALSAPKN